MDVQIARGRNGELPLDRFLKPNAFDQLAAGHHAGGVEAAHGQRAPAQLVGHAVDGVLSLLVLPHEDRKAHSVGRGDGVMLEVDEDQLVARRRVGQADAAGARPSAILRSAPCAASSASDSANKCAKRSAARPRMRKGMGPPGVEEDGYQGGTKPPDYGTRFLAAGIRRMG
jgi:hypothetical protein